MIYRQPQQSKQRFLREEVKGAIVAEDVRVERAASQIVVALADSGAFSNAVILYENFSASTRARTITGGNVVDLSGAADPAIFTRRKTAMGWGPTRQQIAHDGAFDNANGGQALPTSLVNLRLGTDDGSTPLDGTLESVAYYAGARSDTFVQQVSR